MPEVLAIYGSPRRGGNTATLLDECLRGVAEWMPNIEKLVLRDLQITPCLELYACARGKECPLKDDFVWVGEKLAQADLIILASPIMFYTVSAHVKALMDRCQAFWVRKHWLGQPINPDKPIRKGVFISAGASQGKLLFQGAILTVKYFFEALDVELCATLCYRGLDYKGDVLKHPEYLREAYELGLSLQSFFSNLTKSANRI